MKRIILILSLFIFSCQGESQEEIMPNVLIIFTDDQGSIDMNIYGARDLITPNMDALAMDGIRFTQFYAGSPVCSPSRAALMTGRYPHFAGLAGNAGSQYGGRGMPSEQVTLAETLKEAGYVTAHVGKWHLGFNDGIMPNDQGFDYSFGHMGGCIDNYSHFFYWNGPNSHDLFRNGQEVWYDGEYFPDLMVKEINNFINENREKPFFLYWAINMPHYPLQATEKWRKEYEGLDSPRNKYAAFVSTIDEKIGDVMNQLNQLGLDENTIVIYQSDHGHSVETRTFGGGGDAGPYRGAKFSLFEGGIRVPAIIKWPGKIAAGEVRDQLVTGADWYPTILDLIGLPQSSHKINGKSFVPVLNSPGAESSHEYFHWQLGDQWAVRKGDWKLIGNPRDPTDKYKLDDKDSLFLINLKEDISEINNVTAQYPEKLKELMEIHRKWEKDYMK